MDFFAAPTITCGVLYCLFAISHGRWRILHFNVTKNATRHWIIQQLGEELHIPIGVQISNLRPRGETRIGAPVAARSLKMSPVRTSFESLLQRGVTSPQVIASTTLPGNISPPEPTFTQTSSSHRLCTFLDSDWIGARPTGRMAARFWNCGQSEEGGWNRPRQIVRRNQRACGL